MGYKNKTVTKTRRDARTRIIPGVGVETYYVDVPYTVVESVWEPDTSSSYSSSDYGSSSSSYDSGGYSGGE